MKFSFAIATAALFGLAVSSPVVTSYHQDGYSDCGRHEELVGHNCECKEGYIRYRGQCTRCPPDARYSCKYKTCKCNDGYVWDSEANVCREVYEPSGKPVYHEPSSKYSAHEPYYSEPSKKTSVHEPYYSEPYYSEPSKKTTVHEPYYSEPSKKTTVHEPYYSEPTHKPSEKTYDHHYYEKSTETHYYDDSHCGKNERVTPGGGCDCKLGFARLDGVNCLRCPKNGHWDVNAHHGKGACVCNFGFRLEDYECVPDCGENERFTPGGGCDCKFGFVRYNGKDCVKECPKNGHWDVSAKYGKGACVCNFGFRLEDWHCVPDCGENERFTPGGGCDCKSGFVRYNGKDCVEECPKRSYWSVEDQECVCEWGLTLNADKSACVEKKPHHHGHHY